jgi:hypothetical protein
MNKSLRLPGTGLPATVASSDSRRSLRRARVHQNITLAPRYAENGKVACNDSLILLSGAHSNERVFGKKPVSKLTVLPLKIFLRLGFK